MSEILNANPTIRNASDLPSRRGRSSSSFSSKKTSLGLFSSTVPASAYAPDPFSPAGSSDSENSYDDDTVEPIDEQEIYGESRHSFSFSPSIRFRHVRYPIFVNHGPCHGQCFTLSVTLSAFGLDLLPCLKPSSGNPAHATNTRY